MGPPAKRTLESPRPAKKHTARVSWLRDIPNPSLALRAKRVLDVVVAGAGLAAGAPVLGAITAMELAFHGWPPVFTQDRPGQNGCVFRIVKFRTMTNERGPDGELLPDGDRMTAFGRFLRSTSMDELPELWNVLAGDMSLVGPRPLLVRYLPRYTHEQMRRHELPPGITGWAQINGRNALSWDDKFALDLWYIDHWSLALDLKILFATAKKVLVREGISAAGEATMPEFMGSEAHA